MNALESFIHSINLDPIQAMNELQDAGVVSDNCVMACDVAVADIHRAIKWLDERHPV